MPLQSCSLGRPSMKAAYQKRLPCKPREPFDVLIDISFNEFCHVEVMGERTRQEAPTAPSRSSELSGCVYHMSLPAAKRILHTPEVLSFESFRPRARTQPLNSSSLYDATTMSIAHGIRRAGVIGAGQMGTSWIVHVSRYAHLASQVWGLPSCLRCTRRFPCYCTIGLLHN